MSAHSNPSYTEANSKEPAQNDKVGGGGDGSSTDEKNGKEKKETPPAVGVMEMVSPECFFII